MSLVLQLEKPGVREENLRCLVESIFERRKFLVCTLVNGK